MSLHNDNPYNEFIGIMRNEGRFHNPMTPILGTIFKGLPEIVIGTQGIELDKGDLLISDDLVGKLSKGDLVLLVPCGEKFIITTKVVSI